MAPTMGLAECSSLASDLGGWPGCRIHSSSGESCRKAQVLGSYGASLPGCTKALRKTQPACAGGCQGPGPAARAGGEAANRVGPAGGLQFLGQAGAQRKEPLSLEPGLLPCFRDAPFMLPHSFQEPSSLWSS